MLDILTAITGEYRGAVMGSVIAFYLFYMFVRPQFMKKILRLPDEVRALSWYSIWGFLGGLCVMDEGLRVAGALLESPFESSLAGWGVVCFSVGYIAAFYRSLFHSVACLPGALRLARFFLISLTPFMIMQRCVGFVLLSSGNLSFFSVFDCIIYIFGISSLCWLLYISRASAVKRLWEYIESEYDHLPKGVSHVPWDKKQRDS